MAEFCDPETFRIVLMNGDGEIRDYLLKELLPLGFTGKALENRRHTGKDVSEKI